MHQHFVEKHHGRELARRARFALALVLACGACAGPKQPAPVQSAYAPAPDPNAAPPRDVVLAHKPWTDAFKKPAVLIATEIRIEGPVGLLDHVATVQDPELLERVETTIPEGFLQRITIKDATAPGEIKAQLDQLVIVATTRLLILERPVPCDVVVTAKGEVYWADKQTHEEQRGPSLRFEGTIAR